MRGQFPDLEYGYEVRTLDLGKDLFIAYRDEGAKEGEVLLFIHGLMSYIPAWDKVIPELSKIYRCIAIDLPGYGKSSGGEHPGTISFYVDALERFIRGLNCGRLNLVGHSMGGQISISTALRHPGLINSLTLLAPAGFETFSFLDNLLIKKYSSVKMILEANKEQIEQSWGGNFYRMTEDVKKMVADTFLMKTLPGFRDYAQVVYNSALGLIKDPVFNSLKNLKCPTLILFGKNDYMIPNKYIHKSLTTEEVARKGAAEIKNSRLVLLEQCGHFIQFEKPEEVIKEIVEFFLEKKR